MVNVSRFKTILRPFRSSPTFDHEIVGLGVPWTIHVNVTSSPCFAFNLKIAQLNGIENVEFYVGDMKNVFNDSFLKMHGQPDVIITDPPRDGMHKDVVEQLIKIKANRIVYVSCNSATQARDLALLDPYYKVQRVQPVDMFPQTHHVENVVLLKLK